MTGQKKDGEWLTPEEHSARSHQWRRRSRTEQSRDHLFRDWFGNDLGDVEIEAHQKDAQRIGDVIDGVLDEHDTPERSKIRQLVQTWGALLGPELSRHCSPRVIRQKTLLIEVPHSAWMFRLQQIKSDIFVKLSVVSEGVFSDIQFVAGGKS